MKKQPAPMPESDRQPDNYLAEVMEQFTGRFHPVGDIAQATHLYSTDEIHRAMVRHHPGCKVKIEEVYQLLVDSGYTWQIDGSRFSFDLKWLLKQA